MVDIFHYYPSDILQEYRNIPVTTPKGTTTIAVTEYKCRNPIYGGTEKAEEVKDGLIGVSNRAILAESGGNIPYVNVFVGKGSVDEFSTVLALIDKYKDKFVKAYKKSGGARGECAKIMDRYRDEQWDEMLKAVTKEYLGLDCNGFVGNFVKKAKLSSLGPSDFPQQYFSRHNDRLRKSLNDVCDLDILVWGDWQHIAIIDTIMHLESLVRVNVCQSTLGGPQESWHQLLPVDEKRGVYKLVPGGVVGGLFYVMGLNVY